MAVVRQLNRAASGEDLGLVCCDITAAAAAAAVHDTRITHSHRQD